VNYCQLSCLAFFEVVSLVCSELLNHLACELSAHFFEVVCYELLWIIWPVNYLSTSLRWYAVNYCELSGLWIICLPFWGGMLCIVNYLTCELSLYLSEVVCCEFTELSAYLSEVIINQLVGEAWHGFHVLHLCPVLLASVLISVDTGPVVVNRSI
jgi:hypothetical protein